MTEEAITELSCDEAQEIIKDLDAALSELGDASTLGAAPSPVRIPAPASPQDRPESGEDIAPAVPPRIPEPDKVPAQVAAKSPAPIAKPVPVPAPAPGAKPASAPGVKPVPAPGVKLPSSPGVKPVGFPAPEPVPELVLSDGVGKDQVWRGAFLYLPKFAAERDALVKLIDTTAQTVPKKPLFVRWVLYQPFAATCLTKEAVTRVTQLKAVAVVGLLAGLPETKINELYEAFARQGVMFRAVESRDVGKRAMAIDLIADIMLLKHES